jgi:formate dehydrogenase major subunit
MKSYYGKAATPENNWATTTCPSWRLRRAAPVRADAPGQDERLSSQGFNPLATVPNKNKLSAALAKLKYLVIMDPLATETSEFWQNHGEFNDVKPESIQTEVFRLPTTCFAEEEGSLTNSSRVAIWKEAPSAAGRGQDRLGDHGAAVPRCARCTPRTAAPSPTHPQPGLGLRAAQEPSSAELLREINGKALADVQAPADPANPTAPRAVLVKAGQQLPALPCCATTARPPAAAGSTAVPGPRPAT